VLVLVLVLVIDIRFDARQIELIGKNPSDDDYTHRLLAHALAG